MNFFTAFIQGWGGRWCPVKTESILRTFRGVATGWTGEDMSTPLLPEVIPEIDANPVSFYSGDGGSLGVGHALELDTPFASAC